MGVRYPGTQGQSPSTLHSFGVAWSRTPLLPGSHTPPRLATEIAPVDR